MTKIFFTIMELISILTEQPDPYYTDIKYMDHILERYIRLYSDDVSQNLLTDLTKAKTISASIDRTQEGILFILRLVIFIFILDGLKIKIRGIIFDTEKNEPDYGYLCQNENDIILNKKDIKNYLEKIELPLPYSLFPKDRNSSLVFTENREKERRKAYRESFEAYVFDKDLSQLDSFTPKSITEFAEKRRLIQEIKQEKLNFINAEDLEQPKQPNISLQSINTETITCILEILSHEPSTIAQELQRRGVSRARVGQLMNFKKGSSSKEACTKRAARLLK